MIPPRLRPGPSPKYQWSKLDKKNGYVSGDSRESLLTSAKSYFGRRGKKYSFVTRKQPNGTYRIYRSK